MNGVRNRRQEQKPFDSVENVEASFGGVMPLPDVQCLPPHACIFLHNFIIFIFIIKISILTILLQRQFYLIA
jgi:hypothetical protein